MCALREQERIERERIKEAEEAGLFARPEKLSNATEDAREVAEVLSSSVWLGANLRQFCG